MSDTREDILEAATKLFLQKGYEGVSIKDITEAVGMTKGALYHHFPGKEELFGEVIGREFQAYRIAFERLPQATFQDFYQAVFQEMNRVFPTPAAVGRAKESGMQLNHFRLIWDAMEVLEGFRIGVRKHFAYEHDAWSAVVRQAIASGELHSALEPQRVADLFFSSSTGAWLRCLMRGNVEISMSVLSQWDDLYALLKS